MWGSNQIFSGLISLPFCHSTGVNVKFYVDKSLSVSKVSKMTRPCPFLFHTFVSARVSWGCSAQSLWLKTASETRGKHLLKIGGTLEHNVCGLLGDGWVRMTWSGLRDSFESPQKTSLSVIHCPWEASHTWSQNQGQEIGLIFPLRNEKTLLKECHLLAKESLISPCRLLFNYTVGSKVFNEIK